jgi:hypothetical protein
MLGRILGGIATSLLYSAFESWLVAEHFKRGYSGGLLAPSSHPRPCAMQAGAAAAARSRRKRLFAGLAAQLFHPSIVDSGVPCLTLVSSSNSLSHRPHGLPPSAVPAEQSLGQTFSWSVFLGNGLMAIASGQIGDTLVERLQLGRVAPFDAAIVAMLIGGVVILLTWGENYGDSGSKSLTQQFNKAWTAIEAGGIFDRVAAVGLGKGLPWTQTGGDECTTRQCTPSHWLLVETAPCTCNLVVHPCPPRLLLFCVSLCCAFLVLCRALLWLATLAEPACCCPPCPPTLPQTPASGCWA